jgi:hypothetical protein
MISHGIIRMREGEHWWWHAIDQRLSSLLAHAWKRVMEFMGLKGGQRCEPQPDPEASSLHTLTDLSEANGEVDASTSCDFQPDIPGVDGDEDHHHPSIPRTSPYHPDAPVVSENEGQPVTEANDTGAVTLSGSHYAEHEEGRYTDKVFEEPEEVDDPQPSPTATPIPKIIARSATDEPFRYAAVQDDQDIEEHKD